MAVPVCPVCRTDDAVAVLELGELPVLPNSPAATPARAVAAARGDLELVCCRTCAHLWNRRFDESKLVYDTAYENTLHHSPVFREYAEGLADRLIAEFGLGGALIGEFGAGSGHFLALLCDRAEARGVGFDPGAGAERSGDLGTDRVELRASAFVVDGSFRPDFVFSQHALEHLVDPAAVVAPIVAALAPGTGGYHEVPNGAFLLEHRAVWDLIYEHVSVFTPPSFRRLLTQLGLDVRAVTAAFGDQYLAAEVERAPPGGSPLAEDEATSSAVAAVVAEAVRFGADVAAGLADAATSFGRWRRDGPVAVWGAGSKGVSYCNLIAAADPGVLVVDINPRKEGLFIAGSGHRIVAPSALVELRPAHVVIANPLYRDEITGQLAALGLAPEVHVLFA